jgi:hypothetical protein
MSADASAYAALGLEPGADREAVERAYKKLIKQHHPDREGGNSARAAEINRAYRELRRPAVREALELDRGEAFGRRPSLWTAVALLAAVASVALVAATAWMTPDGRLTGARLAAAERPAETMDQPIATSIVDGEIERAQALSHSGDEMALTAASRECHQELRREPSLNQLDRCAAFDSAVILLQDRDPLRDRGPFSELAVTSRLMRGGSLLSNDYLAIDDRLDQIRLRAELALAPRIEPEPPVEAERTED